MLNMEAYYILREIEAASGVPLSTKDAKQFGTWLAKVVPPSLFPVNPNEPLSKLIPQLASILLHLRMNPPQEDK